MIFEKLKLLFKSKRSLNEEIKSLKQEIKKGLGKKSVKTNGLRRTIKSLHGTIDSLIGEVDNLRDEIGEEIYNRLEAERKLDEKVDYEDRYYEARDKLNEIETFFKSSVLKEAETYIKASDEKSKEISELKYLLKRYEGGKDEKP